MGIFKNKILVKLIATICLILVLFNFTGTRRVYAANEESEQVWGGVLIKPIVHLMTAIGDAVIKILHNSVLEQEETIFQIDGTETWWQQIGSKIAIAVAVITAVVVSIALIVVTYGGASAAIAAIAGTSVKAAFVMGAVGAAGTALLAAGVTGTVTGVVLSKALFPDTLYLPHFSMSAEEIFKDEIFLFGINFFEEFDPDNPSYTIENKEEFTRPEGLEFIIISEVGNGEKTNLGYPNFMEQLKDKKIKADQIFRDDYRAKKLEGFKGIFEIINNKIGANIFGNTELPTITNELTVEERVELSNKLLNEGIPLDVVNQIMQQAGTQIKVKEWAFYVYEISENKIEARAAYRTDAYYWHCFDIYYNCNYENNLIDNTVKWAEELEVYMSISQIEPADLAPNGVDGNFGFPEREEFIKSETTEVAKESTAQVLRKTVSTWYFILRNLALLVLMLLLIYSGIRIVIGSTAGEKAKYKERLMDWLVSMCLIFVMHYIMVFAVELVGKITDLIGSTTNGHVVGIELTDKQRQSANELFPEGGFFRDKGLVAFTTEYEGEGDAPGTMFWTTNLMGEYRIQAQTSEVGTTEWVGYGLAYMVLVLFTLFFAWTYLRRVIYMAFLTMIAPLVAMTYPIDKMTDGKAQAFNSWLKEYIFNLMIQPLHLLLYTILVTSAYTLASESALYTLVAIGFMIPAEKLMRSFFGFEKAKTPGLLGGAAGAAIAMTGLQNLLKPRSHGKGGESITSKANKANEIMYKNRSHVDTMESIAGAETNQEQTVKETEQKENKPEVTVNANQEQTSNVRTMEIQTEQEPQTLTGNDGSQDASIVQSQPQPQPQTIKQQEPEEKEKHKRSILRAVGSVSALAGRRLIANSLSRMHPVRLAGKIAAGATVGTAGLLLGIASGDGNKAFQYTTAGAMAGSALAGSVLSNKNGLDAKEIQREAELSYYGEDYKKAMIERQREDFMEDDANTDYLRQTLGVTNREAEKILETTGGACYDNGIYNIEEVAAIHQLTNGKNAISIDQAIAARDYAIKRLPSDTDKMTAKSIKEHKARWENEFREKYKNLSEERAKQLADNAFDLAIRFNKAKSSLTKL